MTGFFFSIAILLSSQAFGYTQVTSVTNTANASIVNPATTTTTPGSTTTTPSQPGNTTSVTVYGGLGGPNTGSCPGDGSSPCDSCVAAATGTCTDSNGANQAPLCACNQARIYNSLVITINVTRSTNPGGGLLHISSNATSTGATTTQYTDLVPPTSTNSISFTWQQVCSQNSANQGTCEGAGTNQTIQLNLWTDNSSPVSGVYATGDDLIPITFRLVAPASSEDVYGDTLNEGIGQFSPFPGDGRVYLNSLNSPSGFPASLSDGVSVQAVRVILSSQNLANATIENASFKQDLQISGAAPSPTYIDGVSNGTGYFVRLAMVDQANNVLQFFPGLDANSQTGCDGTGDVTQCPYYVRPGEVDGLLKNDFNCFIANAAYGTLLEPKLKIFRQFRNTVLLSTAWGRRLVFSYYRYGPYAARFISDKPALRFVTRGLLWPLLGISYGWIHLGFLPTLLLTLLLLTMLLTLPWYGLRRLRARG